MAGPCCGLRPRLPRNWPLRLATAPIALRAAAGAPLAVKSPRTRYHPTTRTPHVRLSNRRTIFVGWSAPGSGARSARFGPPSSCRTRTIVELEGAPWAKALGSADPHTSLRPCRRRGWCSRRGAGADHGARSRAGRRQQPGLVPPLNSPNKPPPSPGRGWRCPDGYDHTAPPGVAPPILTQFSHLPVAPARAPPRQPDLRKPAFFERAERGQTLVQRAYHRRAACSGADWESVPVRVARLDWRLARAGCGASAGRRRAARSVTAGRSSRVGPPGARSRAGIAR